LVCACSTQLFRRIVVADDADLLGSGLEPGCVLLAVVMRRAIAIGCADSFVFVLRLRVRNYVSNLFARVHIDAVTDQFAGGERGPRFEIIFFDLAAQDLFDDQQTRIVCEYSESHYSYLTLKPHRPTEG
jgi:hypothetical protein